MVRWNGDIARNVESQRLKWLYVTLRRGMYKISETGLLSKKTPQGNTPCGFVDPFAPFNSDKMARHGLTGEVRLGRADGTGDVPIRRDGLRCMAERRARTRACHCGDTKRYRLPRKC
jgi:hypothetical protein